MYQLIDNKITLSVRDWEAAGLTYDQFRMDSQRGYLKIYRRGLNGNTLIDVESILKRDRIEAIEAIYGKATDMRESKPQIYSVEMDTEARAYYAGIEDLSPAKVSEYTAKASMFRAMKEGYHRQVNARAASGKKLTKKEFYAARTKWWNERCTMYNVAPYTNARSLERAFTEYCNGGYKVLVHGGYGSDNARKVSRSLENLLLSLWRTNDKPFVNRVHELYMEFVSGNRELFDKETGELYRPEDFVIAGKASEISVATVWRYLKDVVNTTAVYADRNGNFDYANRLRPKQHRKRGKYSLSKISMDDVALSRKSVNGWVYKYIAVDVVSGYYFRPAYIIGKPNIGTVIDSFRNMFCELSELGLPMPGELEVENHLMKDIPWLEELFPFVRFCNSPTEKRAEHNIRSLKWTTAKDAGHTRGRWYAKHEAYRVIRNKVDGDYVEPAYQPQRIVADDLADIEAHNNSLHPLQKTYPGMTRREVFIKNYNPDLQQLERSYLYRFVGNETKTSIRNNDYCVVQGYGFELRNFNALTKLKPNNYEVTAYWLPEATGEIGEVYLYQGDVFIGIAENRENRAYNECAIERTDDDRENMLYQSKRGAKFDKFVKERKSELSKVGDMKVTACNQDTEVEIIELPVNDQPAGYEEDEWTEDWAAKAISGL